MLRDGTFYQDLGADHFRRISPEVQASRLARQIAKLGFTSILFTFRFGWRRRSRPGWWVGAREAAAGSRSSCV
jgi:hypothetical protein